VGENDLIIISSAKLLGARLVTDEAVQLQLPTEMAKYKIPAVCDLPSVAVKHISFLKMVKETGETFE
jgi:hypothetical protein